MPTKIPKYGLEFPSNWTPAHIELACLAHKHPPKNGGLGMHGHLRNAMLLLWPNLYAGEIEPGIPKWRDELELLTWAFCTYKFTSVIGHASAAKTHTFGHMMAACYLADPTESIITLTSTHLGGLRKRLWSDVVAALQTSTLGHCVDVRHHDMTIRPRGTKEDKYIIEGISTDRGQEAVEKIQGNHSRLHRYVVIDEAQGTPPAIFEAASNLMTDQDFRQAMLANPTKKFSEFGTWCEPMVSWNKVDPEIDTHWETKRGGVCVRLDGLKSPNIRHGRTIFPFLVRQDYIDGVKASFGEGSPRWWTFVRGWFAPDGTAGIVIPSSLITKSEQPKVFGFKPKRIAAIDPAFEGGDQCMIAIGEYGESEGRPWSLNLIDMIPVKVVVSETSDPIEYLIAREAIRICKENGLESPADLIGDSTGAGRAVMAIIQQEWGREAERCNFGGSPTDRRLKVSDTETCEDLFDRFVSELWWAARAFMEEGLVGGISEKFKMLRQDLCAREYETVKEKKVRVEPKTEMKGRLGRSPDDGDAFVLLIELIRRRGAKAGTKLAPAGPGGPANRLLKRAQAFSQIVDPNREYSHGPSD